MSQSQLADGGAYSRVLAGDTQAICDLTDVEVAHHGQLLVLPLLNAVRQSGNPQVEAKAAGLLSTLGSRSDVNAYVSVGKLFLERLRTSSCSHDWSRAEGAQIARFYAANLVTLVRQFSQPHALSPDILHSYLAIFCFGQTLELAVSVNLHQTVFQRLDHVLALLFASARADFKLNWLLSLKEVAATPEVSTAVFNALCAMLRDVHLCKDVDGLDFLTAMLLWLPGMDKCVPCSSPLSKLVTSFSKQLPDGFFGAADPSLIDSCPPPWLRWWQSSYKVCFNLPITADLMALLLASFQVVPLASLERVVGLWRSLFFSCSPDRKNLFKKEILRWISLLDDDDLSSVISSTFDLPFSSRSQSTSAKLLKALQAVNSPASAILFSAVASVACPALLTTVLTMLPRIGDNAPLAQCIADILFDLSHVTSHPTAEFSAHESIVMYFCHNGAATFPEEYGRKARETYQLEASLVPFVPPTGSTAKRPREDEAPVAFEMLRRLEDILKRTDDEDLRRMLLQRIKAILP